ncbi:adenylate cyclase type 2-like, partial [Hyaena hyaena]|uniref:adenylate cyclase type 2-like n=1 Tax=Hyaena hyaena TaxID=95912 RepID=UPI00192192E2
LQTFSFGPSVLRAACCGSRRVVTAVAASTGPGRTPASPAPSAPRPTAAQSRSRGLIFLICRIPTGNAVHGPRSGSALPKLKPESCCHDQGKHDVYHVVESYRIEREVEDHVAFLITVPTALAIFFAIFILVCIESVFKKLLRLFSLLIWICLVAMGYLFMCFGGTVSPWDQVSFFLFIIFVVYTMLPFNMRDAVIASVLTASSHTIVLSACLSATPGAKEHLVWQILANVIIFICGSLAGAYHKHLMELALQQTYQDTCNCIKSRIKLEFEKRQQVKGIFQSHFRTI